MSSILAPYLSFESNAREAMSFYESIFGGELQVNTFGQMGMQGEDADKVAHAQLDTPKGYTIMASDTPSSMTFDHGSRITICIAGDDQELKEYFEQLSDGGQVQMPLEPQPWGDSFGMVIDKFGIGWGINLSGAQQG